MHDGRRGELVSSAPGLKLASASRENIFDPLTLRAIGKRDDEPVGFPKHVHRSAIKLARLPPDVSDDPEAGQPSRKQAGNPVSDREIEPGQPLLPESHQEHS